MKITETWAHREKVLGHLIGEKACEEILSKLQSAKSESEWLAIGYANFAWGVKHGILEEWLPAELPNCTHLDCSECTGLTSLPELPNCKHLDCFDCPGLTSLPELPNCIDLDCRKCTGLTKKI